MGEDKVVERNTKGEQKALRQQNESIRELDTFSMPSIVDQYKRKKQSISRKDIRDRLDDLGCDPLKFVIQIMNGKEFGEPHPFLKVLYSYIEDITDISAQIEDDKVRHKFAELTANMYATAMKMLSEGFVPTEIRFKAATELMSYVYAKKKKLEHVNIDEEAEQKASSMEKYNNMFYEDNPIELTNETNLPEIRSKDANNGSGKEIEGQT